MSGPDTSAHVSPPRYDMNVHKWFNNGQLVPGGWLEYGLSYRNRGNSAVHAWLTDTLPTGTSFDGAWRWGEGPMPPMLSHHRHRGVGSGRDRGQPGQQFQRSAQHQRHRGVRRDARTTAPPWASPRPRARPGITNPASTAPSTAGQPNLYVTSGLKNYEPGWDSIRYRINFGNYGDQTVYNVHLTDTLPLSTSLDWI